MVSLTTSRPSIWSGEHGTTSTAPSVISRFETGIPTGKTGRESFCSATLALRRSRSGTIRQRRLPDGTATRVRSIRARSCGKLDAPGLGAGQGIHPHSSPVPTTTADSNCRYRREISVVDESLRFLPQRRVANAPPARIFSIFTKPGLRGGRRVSAPTRQGSAPLFKLEMR